MISLIIRKASQDEQQSQTTITTNNFFIKNFTSISNKKFINDVKIAPDKTERKQNNFCFFRKDMRPVHNKARLQLDKKDQK